MQCLQEMLLWFCGFSHKDFSELVLSQYWHDVRKQYDYASDDIQTLTYPNTKDSRPHLLLSYPGCGITVHMHLVWNPNTVVNMRKSKPLFKVHSTWGLGILSWLNTSLNIKTLKTEKKYKILKLIGRLPVILTGENILVFSPLSAAQHGFCGYLRNCVLEWFHFQAGLRFPKLNWLKTSLKR